MPTVIHGRVPRTSVAEVLARLLPLCGRERIAVIRSIDSSHSQRDLARVFDFQHVPYDLINGNVCMSMDDLGKALDAEMFSGFDEVWVCGDTPPSFDLGLLPAATSDATDFSEGAPSAILDAVERTQCLFLVGDGCGLNYATTDDRIAKEIQGLQS